MRLRDLVETSQALRRTRSRKQKTARLAQTLRALAPEERRPAAAWLAGTLPQGRIGIGPAALRDMREVEPAQAPSLDVGELDARLAELAGLSGGGSGRERTRRLGELFARATAPEQGFLARLLGGELRQGAQIGLLLEALAEAAGVEPDEVRRAFMVSGDLPAIAEAALAGGAAALARFRLELFRPLLPMLAQTADDVETALERLGEARFEWKLDGARVQVHKQGDAVRVYSRRQNEVTAAVPEVVEAARGLALESAILDGETLALRADGSPHAFQTSMRRFGRQRDVAALRDELPLSCFFFDALHLDGEDLLARPTAERLAALEAAVPAALRVPGRTTADPEQAETLLRDALERGHEGAMAKGLAAGYEAGARGAAWLKLKPAHTLDLVVLGAEWGSGRRRGWLSNLHLGARAPGEALRQDPASPQADGFVMVGKTFKGLTDALLGWQTQALLAREVARGEWTVYVRPELVVEIALGGVQASPHYPAGLALRFARVRRYREDKTPAEADTLETLRAMLGDVP